MDRIVIRKDTYIDSIVLMEVSAKLKASAGLEETVLAMATPQNRELLLRMGFAGGIDRAGPSDLVIAMRGGEALFEAAEAKADDLLRAAKKTAPGGEEPEEADLGAAAAALPGANLAVISVAGAYAWYEARKALRSGLHVMLFSDNVPVEREVELKRLGVEKGLLVMGPDCGTAILGGVPLCFANEVRRGSIGIVGASGTGIQEISVLLDRLGVGLSHAIGTGGRDLSREVGGLTMLQGIQALTDDPGTKIIVVVSKPPDPSVEEKIVEALSRSGKPAVVNFIGSGGKSPVPGVLRASSLEEAALLAAAALGKTGPDAGALSPSDEAMDAVLRREAAGKSGEQAFIRGYYTGGTLCDEALFVLSKGIGPVWSNIHPEPAMRPPDPFASREHTLVDLGDDVFTSGRPHPMIDPSSRVERISRESDDPRIAVMMLDVMLGHGSHPDPAGAVLPAVAAAMEKARKRGGSLTVIAEVVGTDRDPQSLTLQRGKLEEAGVIVARSNVQMARAALRIVEAAAGPCARRTGRGVKE
jgi:FdrA protein